MLGDILTVLVLVLALALPVFFVVLFVTGAVVGIGQEILRKGSRNWKGQ
jgi:hypothetical protein